jgi:hypothetical protein
MLLSGEKLTLKTIISVIRHIAGERMADTKTGDDIVYRVAEYLMDKNNKKDDCLLLVKAWLDVADSITVSPDRKQYLAQFAFGIITEHPELVEEMESKLLNETVEK